MLLKIIFHLPYQNCLCQSPAIFENGQNLLQKDIVAVHENEIEIMFFF